jgi:hypothetical protein
MPAATRAPQISAMSAAARSQKRPVHCRNARKNRDARFFHQRERAFRRKARQQDERRPVVKTRVHLNALPERMKKRQGD